MVIENALDLKKSPFSAYSRPKRQQAVENQRKYCKKMQTKREKQKSSTLTGDPLQRVGSELKKRKTRLTNLNYVAALRSRIPHASRFWERTRILRAKDASVSKSKKGSDG